MKTRRDLLIASAVSCGFTGCLGILGRSGTQSAPSATPTENHHSHEDGGHEESTETHEAGDHHHSGLPEEPMDHVEVAMITSEDGTGFHFDPHVAWVTPGGTVTWTIESGDHSTTAYHPENDRPLRVPEQATAWDSDLLTAPGATFVQPVEIEGVYDYYCTPHESMGMIGSLIVGRPHREGQPGLTEPQMDLPDRARHTIEQRNATVRNLLEHEG